MRVYKIEEGDEHWIAARHPAHAIEILAKSYDMTRAEYCKEYPEHTIEELRDSEYIELKLDFEPDIPEHIAKDLPHLVCLEVTARTVAKDWIDSGHEGFLCSSLH